MTDKQNHFTYTDNTSDNNDKIMENLHKQIIIDNLTEQLKTKEQKLEEIKLMLQTIIETNKIYPLQNNLLKLLDIIEGKENE